MKPFRIYWLTLFAFSLLFIGFKSVAQEKDSIVLKTDFAPTSAYYLSDMTLKMKIFEYLKNAENSTIEDLLIDHCFFTEHEVFHSSDTTNKIAQQLNTSGNLAFCITGISPTGDINYRTTYSTNLNINIDKGTLKR
jgi:hypothetical protein